MSTTLRWVSAFPTVAYNIVNLPACSPRRPFNAEHQADKLRIAYQILSH